MKETGLLTMNQGEHVTGAPAAVGFDEYLAVIAPAPQDSIITSL